jgi:hypothetical protein
MQWDIAINRLFFLNNPKHALKFYREYPIIPVDTIPIPPIQDIDSIQSIANSYNRA